MSDTLDVAALFTNMHGHSAASCFFLKAAPHPRNADCEASHPFAIGWRRKQPRARVSLFQAGLHTNVFRAITDWRLSTHDFCEQPWYPTDGDGIAPWPTTMAS